MVEGVVGRFGFEPDKLKKHEPNIMSMLLQLPEPFLKSKGGGWSFLNGCTRQDGVQWGEQRSVDALLCLGIAIGKAKILLPREIWPPLPGGVPYFGVDDREDGDAN
jgi:hypothetical protein